MVDERKVPDGYKITEIGIIPEDWDFVRIGDLGNFSKGAGIRKDQANSGHIPCIRYGELYTKHNDIIRNYYSFISREIAKTSRKLKAGDVLFAGSGETKEEIGKCATFIDETEVYAGGDIIIFSPVKGISEFYGYLLNAPFSIKQKASKGQGDAIVHISSSNLADIFIPFPNEIEQKAIAEALSDTDSLIQSVEKLIDKKKKIKQGAMQQLLTGEKRLPGFSGEWEVKKLGEVAVLKHGYSFSSKTYEIDGKYKVVTIANVQKGFMSTTSCSTIKDLPADIQAHQQLSIDDLLISLTGNVGRVCMVNQSNCVLNQRVGKFVISEKYDFKYVYYSLNLDSFIEEMMLSAKGGAQPNLGNSDVLSYDLCIPNDIEEQKAIAQVLSDMDEEIEGLEEKLKKYKTIKQGMMQELLTGRIRLI